MAIFSQESKFSQIMMRLAWGCYLNLLWFVCSLPIITIGASTTALYYVTLKIAENGRVTSPSSSSARSRQTSSRRRCSGSSCWPLASFWAPTSTSCATCRVHHRGARRAADPLSLALVIVACIAYAFVLAYVFPLLSRVDNTNLAMLKNSLLISIRYLSCTICTLAIHCGHGVRGHPLLHAGHRAGRGRVRAAQLLPALAGPAPGHPRGG